MEFYDTDTEDTHDLTTTTPRKDITIAGSDVSTTRSPPAHCSNDPNSMKIDDSRAATDIDLVDANRIDKLLNDERAVTLTLRSLPELKFDTAKLFVISDASRANRPGSEPGKGNTRSQYGYLFGFCTPDIDAAVSGYLHLIEGVFASIKRVCRGTAPAEANWFLYGVEAADYFRLVIAELDNPEFTLRGNIDYIGRNTFCFTDAGGLKTALDKDAGRSADKRVRTLLAQVREYTRIPMDPDSLIRVRWTDNTK